LISSEIKVSERNKKYVAKNTIVEKTVAKEKKAKGKKQEIGNRHQSLFDVFS